MKVRIVSDGTAHGNGKGGEGTRVYNASTGEEIACYSVCWKVSKDETIALATLVVEVVEVDVVAELSPETAFPLWLKRLVSALPVGWRIAGANPDDFGVNVEHTSGAWGPLWMHTKDDDTQEPDGGAWWLVNDPNLGTLGGRNDYKPGEELQIIVDAVECMKRANP